MAAPDALLRDALPDQLRDRRRDRPRAGVPVRDELVRLLELVGDVFGSPLAIEGLAAFMLEATFIGLWVFGWDRLSPKVHLATIYLVWLGTWLSAYFILAANSWMQRPVGYEISSQTDARRRTTSSTSSPRGSRSSPGRTRSWPGCSPAASSCSASSCWHLRARQERRALPRGGEARAHRRSARLGRPAGRRQRVRRRRDRRPAHEDRRLRGAVGHRAARRVLALPDRRLHPGRPDAVVRRSRSRACSRSWPRTRSRAQVVGINELQAQYEQQYGPGNYIPDIRLVYWSMRAMAYLGTLSFLLAPWGGWLLLAQEARRREVVPARRARRDRVPVPRQLRRLDPDGGRAPAVGRPRAPEDRGRGLATVSAWTVGLSLGVFALLTRCSASSTSG